MTKPLYFYNGSTFELVGPTTPQSPIAYQTSAPTAPATGDLWIDSDGDVDTYNRQLTRYYFVATASQTTITGVDANGLTLAYVAGSEAVYVNGALQVRGQDYTATNGTSITGLSALAVNDVVEIFAYTAFTVANAYTKTETDGVAAAAAGLRMVVPTSVAVGSGTGSVDATGNVTFTTVSSISLNGCFTSTYDNYEIVFNIVSTNDTDIKFRWRVSGADNTTSNYSWTQAGTFAATGTFAGGATNNDSSARFASSNAANSQKFGSYTFFNPFATATSGYSGTQTYSSGTANYNGSVMGLGFNGTTSFDGFTLYPAAGTMTGTIRVYGYKD